MKAPTRKGKLVIGLGSPLSRDDAFGLRVVERLIQQAPDALPHTDLVRADTDLISQIDQFSKYSHVILVDTLLDPDESVGRCGGVVALEEGVFFAWPETSPSVHQISPLVAVKLFRKLHREADTRITLVAFCTDKAAIGTSEADPLEEQIIDTGVCLIRSLLSPP